MRDQSRSRCHQWRDDGRLDVSQNNRWRLNESARMPAGPPARSAPKPDSFIERKSDRWPHSRPGNGVDSGVRAAAGRLASALSRLWHVRSSNMTEGVPQWIAVVCSSSPASLLPALPACLRSPTRRSPRSPGSLERLGQRFRACALRFAVACPDPGHAGLEWLSDDDEIPAGHRPARRQVALRRLHLREDRPRNHGIRFRDRSIRHAARPARALASVLPRHR